MRILTTKNSKIGIIITAAGSSVRMGSGIKKEYLPLNDGTVLSNCAKTFLKVCKPFYEITDFIITCPKNGEKDCRLALQDVCFSDLRCGLKIVEGASSRQSSVFNGLKAVQNNPDIVLIHDGARPFVTGKIILECILAALEYGASVPGVTPVDTQKMIDKDGFIVNHLQRNMLKAVQTPQCFKFTQLLEAHCKAAADGKEFTDDTEIWGVYCGKVKTIDGDVNNIKITFPEDLKRLESK